MTEQGPRRPVVWRLAGSDSDAGAGLQADLKALSAWGVHGCTAMAAATAPDSLDAQLAALAQDVPPQAIKTGRLGSVDNLRVVCRWVDQLRAQGQTVAWVVDPVLDAHSGTGFADEALVRAYVTELLPRATLVTLNRTTAQHLSAAAQVLAHGGEGRLAARADTTPVAADIARALSQLTHSAWPW